MPTDAFSCIVPKFAAWILDEIMKTLLPPDRFQKRRQPCLVLKWALGQAVLTGREERRDASPQEAGKMQL